MSESDHESSGLDVDPGDGACEVRTGALILGLVCGNALIYVLYEGTPSETLVFWIIFTATTTFVGCGCCHHGLALSRASRRARRYAGHDPGGDLEWRRRGWLVMLRTRLGEQADTPEWGINPRIFGKDLRLELGLRTRRGSLRQLVDRVVMMEEGLFREIVQCL